MPFHERDPRSQSSGAHRADQAGGAAAHNHEVVDRVRRRVDPVRRVHRIEQRAVGLVTRHEYRPVVRSCCRCHRTILMQIQPGLH